MAQRVICEVQWIKLGRVAKKLFFMEDKIGFTIYEQDLIPDRWRPVGHADEWRQVFFMSFPQRNLARACFIGRQAIAGYEEGNV